MITAAVRQWMIALFFTTLISATRLPFAPHQLLTFDDVNPAYSIGHFDIGASQPQPTSYPLFVMQMPALSWRQLRRAEDILLTLVLAGSIAARLLAACGNRRSTLQREFAPRAAGSILYTDLPAKHGSRTLGEYELQW